MIGLALIVVGGLAVAGIGLMRFGTQTIGHLLFLGTAVLWACYTVAMRQARLDGLHAAAIAAAVSLLAYVPVYFIFRRDALDASLGAIAWQAFYQGVLTAVLSIYLYGRAIGLLGASSAAAFVALGPVMTAFIAIPVLGEWPTPVDWLAIAAVTVGVYLASGGPLPTRATGSAPLAK